MDDSPLPASALPTLRQLQFLNAIAAFGSFSRAADHVGVTQPTLSSGIKELEAVLGATLVDRSRAGAVLTPAGEEAAARAASVLADVEELARTVRGGGEPLSGLFRLGAIPTVAPFLLPRALPYLRAQRPNLRLLLKEDVTSRLLDALRTRLLDAAVIALPYEAPGIETEPFAEDEFLLACAAEHPLASRNDLRPEDIAPDELLLLEDGHCLRDHALSVCQAAWPRRRFTDVGATSLHTVVEMAAGGLGVTLVPKLAADGGVGDDRRLAVRRFTTPIVGRTLGVAWRAGSPRKAEAQMLADLLREALTRSASPVG